MATILSIDFEHYYFASDTAAAQVYKLMAKATRVRRIYKPLGDYRYSPDAREMTLALETCKKPLLGAVPKPKAKGPVCQQ